MDPRCLPQSRACHANSPAYVSSKIIPRSIFYLFLRRIIFLARTRAATDARCCNFERAARDIFSRKKLCIAPIKRVYATSNRLILSCTISCLSLPSHDTICTYIGASWAHERIYASPNDAHTHTHTHTPIICMKYKRRVQRIIRFLNKFRMHTYRNITRIPKSASKIIASPLSGSNCNRAQLGERMFLLPSKISQVD
uniref:Uncharacterized protein n=1 Tax=Trichogramma kaykai TaxID=54128 RepID=A0ABD2XPS3_9HYME